jgi:hypothetical protein
MLGHPRCEAGLTDVVPDIYPVPGNYAQGWSFKVVLSDAGIHDRKIGEYCILGAGPGLRAGRDQDKGVAHGHTWILCSFHMLQTNTALFIGQNVIGEVPRLGHRHECWSYIRLRQGLT